jgi:cytochrome c oxidase cbb3-type subunit III
MFVLFFTNLVSQETKNSCETPSTFQNIGLYEKECKDFLEVNINFSYEFKKNPFRNKNESVTEGKELFVKHCAVCHKQDGTGMIGPNLTDTEWIHGKTDIQVYRNIHKGIGIQQAKLGRGVCPPQKYTLRFLNILKIMSWISSVNPSLVSSDN